MLRYGREFLSDWEGALRAEWLETNGVGGFASSSILGINTRRYHGLLLASLKPPVARFLLLSKLEEVLRVDGMDYPLSANLYAGAVYPDGHRRLTEVRLEPCPVFRYEVPGAVLEKRLFLVRGENTLVVEWELLEGEGELRVRPLLAFRDYHSTAHANGAIHKEFEARDGVVIVKPYDDLPALRFASNAVAVDSVGEWYLRFQYPREKERGLDYEEDLFCPFEAAFELGHKASMVVSTQTRGAEYAGHFRQAEESRRVWPDLLARAADQFIASRLIAGRLGKTILAGYPWFTDWGRDTMISLPGLTLATGRFDVAKSILITWAGFVDEGMLPNRFPDSGEMPEYNTVDASLWYFEAVAQYVAKTGDAEGIREAVYPALRAIVEGYRRGTRFGIRVDTDGLVEAGPQLTWMDAVVEGVAVTPRAGKAVEIQALWYNALCVLRQLCPEFEADTEMVRKSFESKFWNEAGGCYFDLPGDDAIRPNQLLALSLSYPISNPERAGKVLDLVTRELVTPYGVRTLSPGDSKYRGQCTGGPSERDLAYHQGTVWPWLLGPYVAAARRYGFALQEPFAELVAYLEGPGCGQIPEIFDGDAPHAPRGCTAQAWSVAECIRTR